MQFLYPKSRQFPHDEVCEQIVRALHMRNFRVPGLEIEFHDYGSGDQKLRYVNRIKSAQSAIDLGHHDVVITFHRPQGQLPGGKFNDIAAVSDVQVPRRSLSVYQDESGPTYCVYVGDDWEKDRSGYWTRHNARLDGLPRKCLRYSGMYPRYQGVRPARLGTVEDQREYEPVADEPQYYNTAEVMESFRIYLQDVVLAAIEGHPVADIVEDVFAESPPIPMPPIAVPAGNGALYAYGNGHDARRIEDGRRSREDLAPADRYGLAPDYRLAPLGIRRGPDLPEVAYDGFVWCGKTPNVPGDRAYFSEDVLLCVKLMDARGVYVANHAAYQKRRAELTASIGDRQSFTQEEVNDFVRARARTIVPITEYKDDYEDPIYLINRELTFDEVEVIGKRPQ
jgi:hypothetical protein